MTVAYVSATTCALVTALGFKSFMSTVRFFTNTVVLLLSVGIVSLIFAGKIYESRQ